MPACRTPHRSPAPRRVVLAAVLCVLAGCSSDPEPAATGTPAPPASTSGTPSAPASPSPATTAPSPGIRVGEDRQPTGEPVTLALAGDVHFEGSVRSRLLADPDTALDPVARLLRRADLAMVNLETAVTERGTPEPKQYVFRAPSTAWRALQAGGVDVVTLANNHGLDYGQVGLQDTLAGARRADMPLVGAGTDAAQAYAPWRTTVKGQRLAFFGATQVLDSFAVDRWVAGPDSPGLASAKREDVLLDAVRSARADSDTVVVMLHWGVENQSCPQSPARDLARRLVAAGADVVVGSHAHVLQGSGYLDGAYVHYGLGNFLFYASGGGPNTRSGVLTLTLRGRAVTGSRWDPASLSGGQTTPLTGSAARQAAAAQSALRSCTGLSARP